MTLTNYGLVTVYTTFEEEAAAFRHAASQAHTVMVHHLAWITLAAEDIGEPILVEFTPVKTGELAKSTETHVWVDDGQAVIRFEQPATNRYGTEYAPFVILGHRTRNPEIRVPPNPYNVSAEEEMRDPMTEIIMMGGRRIATDLTTYLKVAG